MYWFIKYNRILIAPLAPLVPPAPLDPLAVDGERLHLRIFRTTQSALKYRHPDHSCHRLQEHSIRSSFPVRWSRPVLL